MRVIEGGRAEEPGGLLIVGAREIATLAGGLRSGGSQGDLALLRAEADDPGSRSAPAIACRDGRIVAVGPLDAVEAELGRRRFPLSQFQRLAAGGRVVTPGLVDPHTHLLFGGTREAEVGLRQAGTSYLEILAAGGGILSTVAATRAASDEELAAHGRRWLDDMLGHGTTTIEAKSGYGLNTETELRLIEIAASLGRAGPVEIVPTFMGAHAVPAEFRSRPNATEAYVRHVIEAQLPAIGAQRLARFCDVFCEEGVFSVDQSRRILEAAAALGLRARLHADELAPSGGAELAAEIGAVSCDHLANPSTGGINALADRAQAGHPVVATLLPATTFFLMSSRYAPARTFIERGVPVALATDFNPGTSPTPNLGYVMTVACLQLRLSPAEALAAVTINAAFAVGRGDEIGSIEPGRQADLVVWDVPSIDQIPYWPAADLVRQVIKQGRIVVNRG
ncbi:MAG TPA: imidazolonepropionase [Candidatus Saccharimonadales bacterium]|nr:imidazolonepropionase [Candidatus Saccharimonadales bacterium]